MRTRCKAPTKKGYQCTINADPGSDYCHIHNPEGTFQMQQRGKVPRRKTRKPERHERTRHKRIPKDVLRLYFDGAIDRNPGGIARYGYVLQLGQMVLAEGSGVAMVGAGATVNIAEWTGLLMGLQAVVVSDYSELPLWVMGDSKMVINQASGYWKIKSAHFLRIAEMVKDATARLQIDKWRWIPRGENWRADRLTWDAEGTPLFQYTDLYPAGLGEN